MSGPFRVALGGFLHETNTFAPSLATLARFVSGGGAGGFFEGEEAVARLRGVNQGFAGALAHNITMPLQDYLLPRKADIAALVRTEVLCTHSNKGQTDFIAASVKNNQELNNARQCVFP